jgi:hypothetical protein
MGDWSFTTTARNGAPIMTKHTARHARRSTNRGLGIFLSLCAAAGIAGVALTPAQPANASGTASVSATVRDYNDGWIDAKRDDCQQGSAAACSWLAAGTDRDLPVWFRAWHTPRRVHGHGCILVGAEGHRSRGLICGGKGYAFTYVHGVHQGPAFSPTDMPPNFWWRGTDRDSAIVVCLAKCATSLAAGDDGWEDGS